MNKKVNIFAERLKKMQGAAASAMEGYVPGGVKVPDSVYMAKELCEMGESRSSGNLMITVNFVISEGEYKGLYAGNQYLVLEQQVIGEETQQPTGERMLSEKGIQKARRWVEQHGIPFPENDLSALEDVVNFINEVSPLCKVRCTTNDKGTEDEFQTSYILQVIDQMPPMGGAVPTSTAMPVRSVAAPVNAPATTVPVVEDGLTAMNRAALRAWINENGLTDTIKLTIRDTDEIIRQKIRDFIASQPVETPTGATTETAQPAYSVDDILVFCAAQGITEVTQGMDPNAIVEIMKGYQFIRQELTEGEITMLSQIGIPEANIIDKPAPAPAPVPAPAPAPVPTVKAPVLPPKATIPAVKPALPKASTIPVQPGALRPGLKK